MQAGDDTAAANLASSMLERDPYDEAALRVLMEAHASAGRSALAVAAYGRARERLSEELGMDPAPETESIYLRILRQESISGRAQAAPGRGHTSATARPALPGRDRELAALDAALERAATGRVKLVVVEGEAGIGKSRLLETWAADAEATGARVLRARCDELERTLPLQPAPVAQELFLVEIGYSLPFALFGFHEGRHYNSNSTNPQASF